MLPNLSRLSIACQEACLSFEDLIGLFDFAALSSLSQFSFVSQLANARVVQQLLSILSTQCSYSRIVHWDDTVILKPEMAGELLVKTFQQLKSRKPIELTLELFSDGHETWLRTLPHRELHVDIQKEVESKQIGA